MKNRTTVTTTVVLPNGTLLTSRREVPTTPDMAMYVSHVATDLVFHWPDRDILGRPFVVVPLDDHDDAVEARDPFCDAVAAFLS